MSKENFIIRHSLFDILRFKNIYDSKKIINLRDKLSE